MTPRGYGLLEEELRRLRAEERPRIVREIEEAWEKYILSLKIPRDWKR